MADEGGWKWQRDVIKKQFPDVTVSSGYRPGSTGSGGKPDYHSRGLAVDIAPPRMEIFNWLVGNYPNAAEIIYTPAGDRQIKNGQPHRYSAGVAAGHYDHIHWAMDGQVPATGAVASGGDGSGSTLGGLSSSLSFFTNTGIWARLAVAIAAVGLILLGIARLTGQKAIDPTHLARKAVKSVKRS